MKSGDKLFCLSCGSHILTLLKDLCINDSLREEVIKQDEGQTPWKNCEKANCRICNKNFYSENRISAKIESGEKSL